MSDNLKPCPFCGGTNIYVGVLSAFVRCQTCRTRTDEYATRFEAVNHWNSRAQERDLVTLACRLVEDGLVSVGRGAEISGMTYYEFEDELRRRSIKWKE